MGKTLGTTCYNHMLINGSIVHDGANVGSCDDFLLDIFWLHSTIYFFNARRICPLWPALYLDTKTPSQRIRAGQHRFFCNLDATGLSACGDINILSFPSSIAHWRTLFFGFVPFTLGFVDLWSCPNSITARACSRKWPCIRHRFWDCSSKCLWRFCFHSDNHLGSTTRFLGTGTLFHRGCRRWGDHFFLVLDPRLTEVKRITVIGFVIEELRRIL